MGEISHSNPVGLLVICSGGFCSWCSNLQKFWDEICWILFFGNVFYLLLINALKVPLLVDKGEFVILIITKVPH